MYSIGEFSRISRLTVKALRLYHEKGILIPSQIDSETGYRYYSRQCYERARVISLLKQMEFPLEAIREILENYHEDSEVVSFLLQQKNTIQARIAHYTGIVSSIDLIISREKESQMELKDSQFEVEEKEVQDILVAGIRFKGKYSDCGQAFGKIAKHLGRYMCGKPLCLYFDNEYKENDADIEACIPVRKGSPVEGITIHQLAGGRCISLIHKGPYDDLSRSYDRMMEFVKAKKLKTTDIMREHYIKGPGMIFRGNPANYLTEIQMMLES